LKALTVFAPRPNAVRIEDHPDPKAEPNQVVVKPLAVGICGSDLHLVDWKPEVMAVWRPPLPLIIGHEIAGVVVEVGTMVRTHTVGSLVAVNPLIECGTCFYCSRGLTTVCEGRPCLGVQAPGGIAGYVSLPADHAVQVPEGVSAEIAALCEPLCVALHAIERCPIEVGDTVVVVGSGPVGLLLALAAHESGAAHVVVVGLASDVGRLAVARANGALTVNSDELDPLSRVLELTEGRGADVAFEVAGHPKAVDQCLRLTRSHSRIGVVGIANEPSSVSTARMIQKEKSLVGSRGHTANTWQQAMQLVPKITAGMNMLVSHRIPMAEHERGFQAARSGAALKVMFDLREEVG
jgi:threonine dehydrogenase-like Zn-dependent dehydrogenase